MSDDPQTMTIDGLVHTCITNTFVDEADGLIAALVEKGVPGKLGSGVQLHHAHYRICRRHARSTPKEEWGYQPRRSRNLDGGRDRRSRPDIPSQPSDPLTLSSVDFVEGFLVRLGLVRLWHGPRGVDPARTMAQPGAFFVYR